MTKGGAWVSGNVTLVSLSALQLKEEMGNIVTKLIEDYKDGQEDRLQDAWDYVQAQVRRARVRRAGAAGPGRQGPSLREPGSTCPCP